MKVDQSALKFNQASIILLLVLAFLFNAAWLVAFVAAVMLVGTLWPEAGLFKQVYARGLKPAGLIKPNVVDDDPQPHLFAQGLGGVFLVLSAAALWLGAQVIGWALAATVIVLASLNLFLGFCLGLLYLLPVGAGWGEAGAALLAAGACEEIARAQR